MDVDGTSSRRIDVKTTSFYVMCPLGRRKDRQKKGGKTIIKSVQEQVRQSSDPSKERLCRIIGDNGNPRSDVNGRSCG